MENQLDTEEYGSSDIELLEGIESVRQTPSMYIGSVDKNGLHHLVEEVVDNSIDEAMAGYCDLIEVTINDDGSITVCDNGRGIPVDEHESGIPAVQVVLTKLHSGGKFDNKAYQVSGGLHGVGVSVVNVLSTWLEITVRRDGFVWEQRYERGRPVSELEKIRPLEPDEEAGTEITFKPDDEIFDTVEFEYSTLRDRLRELAFLNSGVSIQISDKSSGEEELFDYDRGIKEYVEYLAETGNALHDDVIYFEQEENDVIVEIALQFTENLQSSIYSFANNIRTYDGGTHLTGFKTAMTRVVNNYAEEKGLLDDYDVKPKGEDIREGVCAIISVRHPDPQFAGQTKRELGNKEVRGIVGGAIHDNLETYFEQHPDSAERIAMKAIEAAQAREAAKKAREVARKEEGFSNTSLPGKLADCQTKDSRRAELFVVEGDSAGGSCKQGRDNEFQGVLPLRGKILNVERHRIDRILENDQIRDLIQAIGAGVDDEFEIEDRRYNHIIIATDADVDGAHIRTLLLTFFYRYMRPLLENGHVYAAQPPLYRVRCNGDTYDAMSEEEREQLIEEKCNGNASQVQRFKGLGEMNPEQLWDTVMNPENRVLKRLTVEDGAVADKRFSVLMGDEVQPRKEFIQENSGQADWVDI